MKPLAQLVTVLFLVLLVGCTSSSALAFQKKGGREPVGPTPTPASTPVPGRPVGTTRSGDKARDKTTKPPVRSAKLTIIAPPGCRIWIDATEVNPTQAAAGILLLDRRKIKTSYTQATGTITLEGLEPRTYSLRAHKPDYQEYATSVNVFVEQENVSVIALTPLPGKLTVSPSVSGADVEIVNLESNTSIGRYPESLDSTLR